MAGFFSLDNRPMLHILTAPEQGVFVLVRLDEIKEEGIERSFSVSATHFPELQALQESGEAVFRDQLHFALRLVRVGELVEVTGRLRTAIEARCARCLKKAGGEVTADFELTYSRQLPHPASGGDEDEIELSATDLGLVAFSGDALELDGLVEEQVLLALPYRPLCKEECRGLCPHCGVDRNIQSCDCTTTEIHEGKFAALKQLKLSK